MALRDTESSRDGSRGGRARVRWMLVFAFLLVMVLRHDYWNWNDARPLVFGFLPVGLWWQGVVTILACVMMWLMVRLAWPGHLEEEAVRAEARRHEGTEARSGDEELGDIGKRRL